MHDAVLLLAAVAANLLGAGWVALSLEAHWEQVRGQREPLGADRATLLRGLGALCVGGALVLCLAADHPTMAALVWVMTLSGGAAAVAFVLAWRPALLGPLVAWSPARAG